MVTWGFSWSQHHCLCTAANIRYYEKRPALVPLSAKVNVTGLENVIKGSLACGAMVLIATSSGSIGIESAVFLLAPWEPEPKFFTQGLQGSSPR